MNVRRFLSVASAALVVGLSGNASASVMVESSVPKLTRDSDLVARGKVTATESKSSRDGKRIFTLVTLEVDEAWKGEATRTVQIQVPGGSRDGISQIVQGAPRFQEGEEVVVFLRDPARKLRVEKVQPPGAAAKQPPLQVVGMAQGKLEVKRDESGEALVAPDLTGLELVRPGTHEPVSAARHAEPVQIDRLKQEVRSALP